MAYKELVSNYERTRRITPNQHVELVTIPEKRLARGSRIQSDYFESKPSDSVSPRTWESAMMRVITVVTAAREAIRMSRSYGNPDLVYSFPSTAVPPPHSSKKRGSTLATREAEPPSGKSTLAVRTSLDVPLVAARVCRSCGNPAHMLPACPVLYYTDTNTDHSCNWSESIVGQAWLANGEDMWQERLILPGYEIRQRYHPAGSPPFLMTTIKKAKNNYGSGNQSNQNQGNQGNQGNQAKETKVTTVTKVIKTKVIKVTKVTSTEETKTKVLVTKVLVGVIRGRIPVGANTTHPRGGPTCLPIQQDKIKVQMIIMLINLTCRTYLILCRSFYMPTKFQRLFKMNICMTLLLSPLTT